MKTHYVFANRSEEDEIYPLTTVEIAEAQRADAACMHLFKRNAVIDQGLEIKLIENTLCVCKDGRLVIPKPPLSATPWTHSPRRDDERCDILERYSYHHLVNNKVLQDLPNK